MRMHNVRPNFSSMQENEQRQFFWQYADNRTDDFQKSSLTTIKQKKTSSKEPKLKVTEAQLQLLKALGLV